MQGGYLAAAIQFHILLGWEAPPEVNQERLLCHLFGEPGTGSSPASLDAAITR